MLPTTGPSQGTLVVAQVSGSLGADNPHLSLTSKSLKLQTSEQPPGPINKQYPRFFIY